MERTAPASPRPVWLLVALPLLVWHGLRFADHTIDDAAITFAYAETFVETGAMAIRPDEAPIEAYTNALWLFLLIPFAALGFDLMIVSKLLGAGAVLGACGFLDVVVRRLAGAGSSLRWVAPALLCGAPLYGFWAFAGLETALHGLLLLAVAWFAWSDIVSQPEGRRRWLGPAAEALLVISRPDGALAVLFAELSVFVACSLPIDWRRRLGAEAPLRMRDALTRGARAAMLYGVYFVGHFAYFGEVFPNSYRAKSPSAHGIEWTNFESPGWLYVRGAISNYGLSYLLPAALLAALAFSKRRGLVAILLGVWLTSVALPVVAGGDWMPEWRMVAMGWPPLVALLVLGLQGFAGIFSGAVERWGRGPGANPRRIESAAVAALAAICLVGLGPSWVRRSDARHGDYAVPYAEVSKRGLMWAQIADDLGLATPVLADVDAGGVTWNRDTRYVDLGKLADYSLPRWHPDTLGHVRPYVLHEVRPDLAHLHGAWNGAYRLGEMAAWREDFVAVSRRVTGDHGVGGSNFIRGVRVRPPSSPTRAAEVATGVRVGSAYIVATDAGARAVLPVYSSRGNPPSNLMLAPCGQEPVPSDVRWSTDLTEGRSAAGWAFGLVEAPLDQAHSCLQIEMALVTAELNVVEAEAATIAEFVAQADVLRQDPFTLFDGGWGPLGQDGRILLRALFPGGLPSQARAARAAYIDAVVEATRPVSELDPDATPEQLLAAASWHRAAFDRLGRPGLSRLPSEARSARRRLASRSFDVAQDLLDDKTGRPQTALRLMEAAIDLDSRSARARVAREDARLDVPATSLPLERLAVRRLTAELRETEAPDTAERLLRTYERMGRYDLAARCLRVGPCAVLPPEHPVSDRMVAALSGRPVSEMQSVEVWGFEEGDPTRFTAGDDERAVIRSPGDDLTWAGYSGWRHLHFDRGNSGTAYILRTEDQVIEHESVAMLVGGGPLSDGVSVRLVVDDEVVEQRAAPGRSTMMNPIWFDLVPWQGRVGRLEIADEGDIDWGIILVDDVTWTPSFARSAARP